jgi:hypothetical protein
LVATQAELAEAAYGVLALGFAIVGGTAVPIRRDLSVGDKTAAAVLVEASQAALHSRIIQLRGASVEV